MIVMTKSPLFPTAKRCLSLSILMRSLSLSPVLCSVISYFFCSTLHSNPLVSDLSGALKETLIHLLAVRSPTGRLISGRPVSIIKLKIVISETERLHTFELKFTLAF